MKSSCQRPWDQKPPSALTSDLSLDPLLAISIKTSPPLATPSLMPAPTHTRPSNSDNKAHTGSQKQQKQQHLRVMASHHSVSREVGPALHSSFLHPQDGLKGGAGGRVAGPESQWWCCPLPPGGGLSQWGKPIAFPPSQRMIHTLLKGPQMDLSLLLSL